MAKELKQIVVDEFRRRFSLLDGCILIDYHGLNAEQTVDLRSTLRQRGAKMTVIHNRLMRHAVADRDDLPAELVQLFRGPIAILYGGESAPDICKAYDDWRKKNKGLGEIKGGLLEGNVISPAEVEQLAKLPDKDTLRRQAAGTLLAPLSVLASAAKSVLSHFAGCVEARQKDLEGGE